jgi:predicted amidohydrolase
MSRLLGLGACEITSVNYDVEHNLKQLESHIYSMKHLCPWIKLVITNELALTGNVPHPEKAMEPIPGPITDRCRELAKKHNIFLIPGSLYESAGNEFYNTLPVIDPEGEIIATYRKMYPWRPAERSKSGNEPVVFEIPGVGKIGLTICYDIWFPELIRDLVWKGAEIILHPTATYTADRQQEHIICQATAIQNQCFLVDINGMGDSGFGQSMIVDPEGHIVQRTGQTGEFMMAHLDIDRVYQTRKYGTCSTAQVLSSYMCERHSFDCYQQDRRESALYPDFAEPKNHTTLDNK